MIALKFNADYTKLGNYTHLSFDKYGVLLWDSEHPRTSILNQNFNVNIVKSNLDDKLKKFAIKSVRRAYRDYNDCLYRNLRLNCWEDLHSFSVKELDGIHLSSG